MRLRTTDLRVIRGVLDFANVEVTHAGQVEELCEGTAPADSLARPFLILEGSDWHAYKKNDQPEARSWLDAIIAGELKAVLPVIQKRFNDTVTARWRMTVSMGQPNFDFDYTVQGIQGWYSLAIGLLIDPERDLIHRIGKCHLEDCGKYFFDDREKAGVKNKGRRKTKFCSPEHANVDKVRRFRAKHSKKHK